MRLLLDTHTLLWTLVGTPELSARAGREIADAANTKFVSVASFWEIAIKVSTGKLTLRQPLAELMMEVRSTGMIHVLPIADAHLVAVSALPFHHRDPFDRLIIAQALAEGMAVAGNDPAFDAYGVVRVW